MVIPNDGPSDNAWGVDLVDPVLVSHQSLLVLFARARAADVGTLYFRVLDPSAASSGDDLDAWNGWYRYRFPEAQAASLPANAAEVEDIPGRELRLGGMELITVPPVAEPVATADASFRVLSEGSFLSVHRQSAAGTLLLTRLGLLARSEDEEGVKVTRYALEPAWEVRFRRSGLRDVPLDRTDGQSYLDPVDDPFYEPTVELARVTGVSGGMFDVARVPSAVPEQSGLYVAVATATAVHLQQVRQSGHALVDSSDEPTVYPPIQPTLRTGGTPLTPIPGLAPALVFYAEQEEAKGPDGERTELQRAGHLMLAIPVQGGGLTAAVAVYDFALDRDGNIPVLPPSAQSVVLVDGTLTNGTFTPDTNAAHYPQSADLPATVQVVDRLVVSSMVLGQVQPTRSPVFHFGDDGLVHLYYGGPPPTPPFDRWSSLDPTLPQAMVAQFDARANRLVLSVPWQESETEEQGNGAVDFIALQSGCTMTGATVAVTDGRLGDGPVADDLCTVRITYPAATTLPAETWVGVPRSLGPFMDVLTGAASRESADPDVLAGTQPFFDCSGRLPVARLPLALPSGVGSGPDPKVTVVSTRADLGLTSVTVTASGATQDHAFTFGDAAGANVKVTWRGVPAAVATYRDVFDGAAASATYAYPTDATATPLFALGTDAAGVPAPVLLYATGGTTDITTVAVATAAGGKLDVTFAKPGGDVVIAGLAPEVDGFVAGLRADPKFQALHLGLSSAQAGGDLVPTADPVGPMDLASTGALFDVLVPAIGLKGATVEVGPYRAGTQGHTFDPPADHSRVAPVLDPTRMVGFLATSVRPGTGTTAYVLNRAPTEVEPSPSRSLHGEGDADPLVSGVWIRQPAHWQCGFTPTTNVTVPVVANGRAIAAGTNLRPQRDWTLETWVRPDVGKRQRLVTFLDDTTPVADGAPKLAYTVSLESQQVVCGQSYVKTPGNPDSSYFQTLTSENADFMPAGGFTWEFWVKPDAQAGPPVAGNVTPIGGVIQVGALDSTPFLTVGLTADRHVQVTTFDAEGSSHTVASDDTLPAADWSHVALTGEQLPADKTWTLRLMIDADVDATWPSVSIEEQEGAFLTIGSNTADDATVFGRIAQLRYWSHARSAADIRRTWLTSVSGSESGLLGNWPLSDLESGTKGTFAVNTALVTGTEWDASLYLFKHQVVTTADDSFFLSTVASVGDLPAVEADTLLANGRWNHLALVYQAGGGLAMNPAAAFDAGRRDWLDCGRADAVGTGGRFAIDTWLRVDGNVEGPIGTIMARWDDPGDPGNQSFIYGIDDAGEMNLSLVVVADTVGTIETLTARSTGAALTDGVTHHVAVAVTWQSIPDQNVGITWTVTFSKDGAKVGTVTGSLPKASSLQVQSSRNDVTVGCAFAPVPGAAPMPQEGFSYLRATLGRTRVWVKAPALTDLFPERHPRLPRRYAPDGLAVQWSFREQAGRIALDDIGGIEAKLSTSAMRTSLADTSTLAFVANGAWVGRIIPAGSPLEPATAAQFTLGAPLGSGPAVAGLQGDIAQVALFDEARSVETIQDQMYVPRWGDATSLVACWNFSRGGADITGGQNDIVPLLPDTRVQASTAPLTIEGPYVRNVYGGVMTDHSQSAPGRMAVGSYADAQDVGTARQRAVLKRQYVVDPDQTVARAIQIGELGLTYLGQVQTSPTLIGYIEGAPPVPSENLTRPHYLSGIAWANYLDTATVTLVQEAADTVTFTSSSSWATGVELNGAFGLMAKSTEAILFGLPGIATWTETLTSNFKIQAVAKASVEVGGATGTSVQSVWGATQRDTMGVNGDWEPVQNAADYLDPAIGRRFVVDNGGYALVQSLTADLYALTFRATGAAVGTIILPNPAIPPDRNIIVFPMNNQYTKNGTLDGKVGLANDPAYTDADERRRSLFRPIEAYALAGRIDRQQQRARSVADQFDPQRKAHGWDTGLDDARAALSQDFSTRSGDAVSVANPVQGLVNRYVWTADGGLHTEEQANASTSTHSYTGEIARGGGGGFHGEGEYYFKLGVAWSFDVMATHRVDVSVSKQLTSQQALHLDVKVAGEALLRTYDPTADGEYPPAKGKYLPGSTPGKVRNYRFMTFYLPPASTNSREFRNIVDPVWLRMSNDNNARALRQLDAASPTWRVLHRVTYVERIPPPISSRPLYTPARTIVAPVNVEGNADLIRLVDAQIPASVAERTRLIVGNAVAATLNPAPKADHTYPTSALELVVPWWRGFLDRARPVGDKPLADAHVEAAALLHALVTRTTAYLYDGYASGAFDDILE